MKVVYASARSSHEQPTFPSAKPLMLHMLAYGDLGSHYVGIKWVCMGEEVDAVLQCSLLDSKMKNEMRYVKIFTHR